MHGLLKGCRCIPQPAGGLKDGRHPVADGKEGQRRFVHDSPLEGAGFEPSVPHQKGNAFRDSTVQLDPSQAGVPWDAI